jgi:hypothetical protein
LSAAANLPLTQVSEYSLVKKQSSSCTSAQVTEPVYFNSWPEGQEKAVVKAMIEPIILRHEARSQSKLLQLNFIQLS